jgi:4-aminobutyrate aminotransferase
LYDTAGRRYLDFTCGIGVTNTGHCHPKVVAAIQAQAAKLIHGQLNIVYHQPALDLIAELLPRVPPGLDSFFFSNSGAEAIEAAVKLAKHATGRGNVIVFSGSFHGRTHLTMAMTTSKTSYRARYQPLVPGIFVAPYPYAYYYGLDEEQTTDMCLRELKKLLKSQTAPEETACVVIEPVLGEGGYVVPPKRFLRELRALCSEHNILLVADEIQSGFGRTGKFFAVEHFDIVPDVMTMAKGIASGLPLSCVVTRQELAAKWQPGAHGGTYGGNAVACAAGAVTVRVIREEKLVENAAARGAQLLAGLRELQAEFPIIGDVRGLGLMTATEFTRAGKPDPATSKGIAHAALQSGLMLLTCGTYDNIIRWIPPLVVTEQQISDALNLFAGALAQASRT